MLTRKNHIFLQNESILNFQHKSLEGYNFVVAYHTEKKCFHGVLGFISPGFYVEKTISPGEDIWLAIWKVEKKKAEENLNCCGPLQSTDAESPA